MRVHHDTHTTPHGTRTPFRMVFRLTVHAGKHAVEHAIKHNPFANPYFVHTSCFAQTFCLEWTRPVGHLRAELTSSTARASYNIGVPSLHARARPAALYGGPQLRGDSEHRTNRPGSPTTARHCTAPRGISQYRPAPSHADPRRGMPQTSISRYMPVHVSTYRHMSVRA